MHAHTTKSDGDASPAKVAEWFRNHGYDWLVITVSNDAEWKGLCRGMDNPQWSQDERFISAMGRYYHQEELDSHIQEWTREQDKLEAMHLLQSFGVPAQAVLDSVDMFADPNLADRGFFQELPHPTIGVHAYPGYLWKMSGMNQTIQLPSFFN